VVKNKLNTKQSVYLSLGSNLGDRASHLRKALELLSEIGIVNRISSIYQTEAWGYEDPRPYLNMVCELISNENVFDLHESLKRIERDQGRSKKSVNADYSARTLDIDILFFGTEVIHTPELIVPHPRIEIRNFVLVPLVEIAASLRHPVSGLSMQELLKATTDRSRIERYENGI
jgi:2-amino-4-hydroxy-6-hydroxymethyldihydropteridine diphosphokinase